MKVGQLPTLRVIDVIDPKVGSASRLLPIEIHNPLYRSGRSRALCDTSETKQIGMHAEQKCRRLVVPITFFTPSGIGFRIKSGMEMMSMVPDVVGGEIVKFGDGDVHEPARPRSIVHRLVGPSYWQECCRLSVVWQTQRN